MRFALAVIAAAMLCAAARGQFMSPRPAPTPTPFSQPSVSIQPRYRLTPGQQLEYQIIRKIHDPSAGGRGLRATQTGTLRLTVMQAGDKRIQVLATQMLKSDEKTTAGAELNEAERAVVETARIGRMNAQGEALEMRFDSTNRGDGATARRAAQLHMPLLFDVSLPLAQVQVGKTWPATIVPSFGADNPGIAVGTGEVTEQRSVMGKKCVVMQYEGVLKDDMGRLSGDARVEMLFDLDRGFPTELQEYASARAVAGQAQSEVSLKLTSMRRLPQEELAQYLQVTDKAYESLDSVASGHAPGQVQAKDDMPQDLRILAGRVNALSAPETPRKSP